MSNHVKNPSFHSFSLSLKIFFSIIISIRFRFSTWYQSLRALTSNSILPLPHLKKNPIQNAPHHKSYFSENLIAQISRPSRDWSNNINQSPFRPSTRLHTRSEALDFLQILTRRRNYQSPDLHHPGTDQQNQHHQSTEWRAIYFKLQKPKRSKGGRASTRHQHF